MSTNGSTINGYYRVEGVAGSTDFIMEKVGRLSLPWELMDISRVDAGAVGYLMDHDTKYQLGDVVEFDYDGENLFNFAALVPEDSGVDFIENFIKSRKKGLRKFNSLGNRLVGSLIPSGRDPDGIPRWTSRSILSEISNTPKPSDIKAVVNRESDDSIVLFNEDGNYCIIEREMVDVAQAFLESTEGEWLDMERNEVQEMITETFREMIPEIASAVASAAGEEEVPTETPEDVTRELNNNGSETETPEDVERPGKHEREEESEESETETPEDVEREQSTEIPESRPQPKITKIERALHNVSIHTNGRPHGQEVPIEDVDVGNYFRYVTDPNGHFKDCRREEKWVNDNFGRGFYRELDELGHNAVIPFSIYANGPDFKERMSRRTLEDGISFEDRLAAYLPKAEQMLNRLYGEVPENLQSESQRALGTGVTSLGATASAIVDVARSIMWLTEQDAAMGMMNPVVGIPGGEWRGFYGNAKPTVDWVVEAADLSETNPTFVRITKTPLDVGMFWKISTRELAYADIPISAKVEAGASDVFRTRAMRAYLSGANIGTDFASDAQAIVGLINSGLQQQSAGANLAAYTRDDMVDAESNMFGDEVDMTDLGWILDNNVSSQLVKTRVGGTESIRFVLEDKMVDSGYRKIPSERTIHLGKAATHNVAILLQRGAALPLVWGPGMVYNQLQIAGKTTRDYDIQLHTNFAFLNPKRGRVLTTTGA